MAHVDGAQQVTVAGLIVSARRLMKPWQDTFYADTVRPVAMIDLIMDAAGLGEDCRELLTAIVTRLYVPVTAEQIAELEQAVGLDQGHDDPPHCRHHIQFRSDCGECVAEREFS